jgi:SAM-dependent methyltransferase
MQEYKAFLTDSFGELLEFNGQRKEQLARLIANAQGWTVCRGPFKGLKFAISDLYLSNKLLGIYEECLHPWIEQIIAAKPDKIVNVGCGDGYYGIGLGRRCPDAPVTCIDIVPEYVEYVHKNAKVNKYGGYRAITESTPEVLESEMFGYQRPFVFMDCEGAEKELLDPEKTPSLCSAYILVELHPFIVSGIEDLLTERFSETHTIHRIQQTTPSIHIPELHYICDWDKMILLSESRPCSMEWFCCIPRKTF